MSSKNKASRLHFYEKMVSSRHWPILLLWVMSFCTGMFFGNRIWMVPEARRSRGNKLGCNPKPKVSLVQTIESALTSTFLRPPKAWSSRQINSSENVLPTRDDDIQALSDRIRDLEMILETEKADRSSLFLDLPKSSGSRIFPSNNGRKYLMVVGINTAFGSRPRRTSVRETWLPKGGKRKKLEEEKGIVIRFVIGHSSTPGGLLDKEIDAEDEKYGDFLRLEHVEGYHRLSAKTKTYFSTAVALWDADFYVKVDDDVHLNIGTLERVMLSHHNKPRVYIGCMKSGPVLSQEANKYHEPEYWKFGVKGNKYFRHAAGQTYAISKELASYIAENQKVLHKYANEDVSVGAWLIGLNVEHVNERRFCCRSPLECELRLSVVGRRRRRRRGCVATFDWECSGICNSPKRMKGVHQHCGEDENTLWHVYY